MEVFADKYAQQFYSWITEEIADRWIQKNIERYRQDGFGMWVLELHDSARLIGNCGLTIQHFEDAEMVEVGYHIHADFRHRGLATEASRACLQHGFQQNAAERIVSFVRKDNAASIGVAAKIHRQRISIIRHDRLTWMYFTTRAQALAARESRLC